MKPKINSATAVYVTQNRLEDGVNESFPWPRPFASVQSAKNALKDHVAKMAQHYGMETPPVLNWTGDASKPIRFEDRTYTFRLTCPGRHAA